MYNKCVECGSFVDPDLVVEYNKQTYCIDCYEEKIAEEQDEEFEETENVENFSSI